MADENDGATRDVPARPSKGFDDAYGEGFLDGRRSMALAVVRKLMPLHSDAELSNITGLAEAEIAAIRDPTPPAEPGPLPKDAPDAVREADGSRLWLRENPAHGTMLVEPGFVRLVRTVRGFTQATLARRLGVHERTVCAWETADQPIRMRTATYAQLKRLSLNEPEPGGEAPEPEPLP